MSYTNHSNFRKPGQIKAFFAIAWYALKAQTRNPATFFFGFIFPIVFISIFGLIGNNPPETIIGVPTNPPYESTNDTLAKQLEKEDYITVERTQRYVLETKLRQGKIAGITEYEIVSGSIPAFELRLMTSSANPQQAGILSLMMSNMVATNNQKFVKEKNPDAYFPTRLVTNQISGRQPRYIDFALPGQIGFALLSTALFGTVFGLIYLKKAGILKRMFATPTKPLTILVAQGTSRLVVALAQTILIVLVGVFAFKFYLPHGLTTFLDIILLSVFGLIAFLGFGYLIAGLSNDENSASPLTNLITLPQFLLSGTFFPTDALPTWLQPVARNLPLTYFNESIRHITTEEGTLVETWPYLLGLLAWGAATYILAAKTFKWE